MKAEHRKELQTNALADHLGRFVESLKAGPRASTIVWILVILIVGVFVAWKVIDNRWYNTNSELWTRLDAASTPLDLSRLASENRGTVPARTARFQEARIHLQEGLQRLGATEQHLFAVESLQRARTLYQQLAQEFPDTPVLYQESLMALAQIEESLSGAAKPDQPGQTLGDLTQALHYYQKLADSKPESFQTRAAAKRAAELKDKDQCAKILSFYLEMSKRGADKGPKLPSGIGLPGHP